MPVRAISSSHIRSSVRAPGLEARTIACPFGLGWTFDLDEERSS
jgi:hypothetical protein